jgi:hypothetical protein
MKMQPKNIVSGRKNERSTGVFAEKGLFCPAFPRRERWSSRIRRL